MKDNYLNVFKYKSGYNWHPRCWGKHIKHFFLRLKYAYQRATRGYCDRDLWNLDNFYTGIFINSLIDFNCVRHGYPGVKPFETDGKWSDYINEMVTHFQNVEKYYDFVYGDTEEIPPVEEYRLQYEEAQKEVKKALSMLAKAYFGLWD